MFYYRLYSVDVADGGFIDVLHFFSQSDATAIDEVESEMLAAPKELWNRGRKVKDFPACPIPAPALDGANRLAGMVARGGGWRWNPLAGHCQIVAASDPARSPNRRAAANDRTDEHVPLSELRLTDEFTPGEMPCTRHFI